MAMKKMWAACVFAAVLSTGAAFADTMNAAFDNTIVITYPSGGTSRYHFNRDGTFTATVPSGAQMRGRWEVAGAELCFIAPSGDRSCSPFVADKNVGDTWEQRATDGTSVRVTLEAGRSGGTPGVGGAFADTMRAAFANTIVITYPSGGVSRYHFNEDHTFTATVPSGARTSGLWDVTADQLCLTALSGDRSCLPFPAGKRVGDTWTQAATDGTQIRAEIVSGR
jgi:hypothetical protein